MELKGYQRSFLAKEAHGINPTVMLGAKGLTDALVKQTSSELAQHELIKVKFVDFKSGRKELSAQLAEKTGACLVRVIGNVAILYKQSDDEEKRNIRIPVKK